MLLVEGLTVNLISVSQLCDQGSIVNFSKLECSVMNGNKEVLMKGTRSKEGCYVWRPQENCQVSECLNFKGCADQNLHRILIGRTVCHIGRKRNITCVINGNKLKEHNII